MTEKQKPQERPTNISRLRNGLIKDKPLITKIAVLPPPATKTKK